MDSTPDSDSQRSLRHLRSLATCICLQVSCASYEPSTPQGINLTLVRHDIHQLVGKAPRRINHPQPLGCRFAARDPFTPVPMCAKCANSQTQGTDPLGKIYKIELLLTIKAQSCSRRQNKIIATSSPPPFQNTNVNANYFEGKLLWKQRGPNALVGVSFASQGGGGSQHTPCSVMIPQRYVIPALQPAAAQPHRRHKKKLFGGMWLQVHFLV